MIYVVVKLAKTTPAATRNAARRVDFEVLEAAMTGARNDAVALDSKDRISVYYTELRSAEVEAARLATQSPTCQYAVLGLLRVFETTEPKIISKVINESGELVLEK